MSNFGSVTSKRQILALNRVFWRILTIHFTACVQTVRPQHVHVTSDGRATGQSQRETKFASSGFTGHRCHESLFRTNHCYITPQISKIRRMSIFHFDEVIIRLVHFSLVGLYCPSIMLHFALFRLSRCRKWLGQLPDRADERRPVKNPSNLQVHVHDLWSVQWLSESWRGRQRHVRTDQSDVPIRHCSRLLHEKQSPLPRRSQRVCRT